ncbi:hypothetical protein EVAR_57439_1 [Eumeta japonica]|uniref:Uncharacterized protein n=1 Tax=Eumeta variegata TaxID=151549 RepID=A0A4C1YDG7_EUMVA|nr:hypothetical protein EVAR_57439_1 [Eumeta japonica]
MMEISKRELMRNRKMNGASLAIMNGKSVLRQARFAIHNGVLISTLMYGSESWMGTLTDTNDERHRQGDAGHIRDKDRDCKSAPRSEMEIDPFP